MVVHVGRRKSRTAAKWIKSVITHALVGLVCLYIGIAVNMNRLMQASVYQSKLSRTLRLQDDQTPMMVNDAEKRAAENRLNVASSATVSKTKNDGHQQKQSANEEQQNVPRRKRPFPDTSSRFLVDFATVPRDAFNELIDVGVPLDYTVKHSEDVIVLYTSDGSMPTDMGYRHNKTGIDPSKALENCHEVKLILQAIPRNKHRQCFAILPQFESYTIHKWMRIPPPPKGGKTEDAGVTDLAYPLQNVARDHQPEWKDAALGGVPKAKHIAESNQLLMDYLKNRDRVLGNVTDFLQKTVMKNSAEPSLNTLVVMTCNKGQSIMFHNFVCNARAKGLDLSHVVMFATDEATLKLGQQLGIHTWYDEAIFGAIPEESANQFGDQTFTKIMMIKVYCMHLAMSSGYNILFQDVDVVWHKNPLPYLLSKDFEQWDMIFQDDGSRVWRYAPYAPNSGFYFVRNNPKTSYFFETFLRMGDLIQVAKSHQHALNDLLIEFSSWKGLRVKVMRKGEDNVFPGGVEFHNKPNFMKEMINGTRKPYVFHMSWTRNKDNKQKFLEQLGEWYTMHENRTLTNSRSTCVGLECCLAAPNITCHYSDKPSKIPCLDSPRIDGDKSKSTFW